MMSPQRAPHPILTDLLTLARPLEALDLELENLPPQSAANATLQPEHLIGVLNGFIDGHLAEDDVERWANLVEMREDITVPLSRDTTLQSVLHKLANPTVAGAPLDRELAREMIALLKS
ncbi:MAG: hypothetical protein J5J00_01475 [Deltaproteobacteria bacterium]|nr:hypothetical protein [Deltaproteobacteria bacterium]